MTEDERQDEIMNVVRVYALMHRDPEIPTEERQRVRVYVQSQGE